jgi:hypothetical protein
MATPINKADRMPAPEDLDPGTGYCWWFSRMPYGWLLQDASWADDYEYWLPYKALPDPDVLVVNEMLAMIHK